MAIDAQQILAVLDSCCDNFTFPMLDNGYVYLAATRLSLYRTTEEWAMVIEVFGYNPRAWLPDTAIYAFASTIHNRDIPNSYGPREISNLLTHNPNNDFHPVYPIEQGDWQDDHDYLVAPGATEILIRGQKQSIPAPEEYSKLGIMLENPPRVQSFELCRFLAHVHRDLVLATDEERRFSILPTMPQILQLDEWHHPNVGNDTERPSRSQTFQQLAQVLATGDRRFYQPSQLPNTHWRNWPEGGTL